MTTQMETNRTDSNLSTTTSATSYGYSSPEATLAGESSEGVVDGRSRSTDPLPVPGSLLPQEGDGKMSNSREENREDPLAGFARLASKLNTLWLSWTYPFASSGKRLSVHYSCDLPRSRAKYIRLGNRVTLGREVWLNIPNVETCYEAAIILEDGCGIGRRSVISAKNQIHIQRNTIFGPSVLVMDHNHAFEDVTRPIAQQPMTPGGTIRIEEGCWIGFGAAIICSRGELVIGRGCVVGANSVVSRSVPAYSVVSGNPAKVVKQYDPVKKAWVIGSRGFAGEESKRRTDSEPERTRQLVP
jgi:acetyltransferase-like isoleucine patch superfamily enzyme